MAVTWTVTRTVTLTVTRWQGPKAFLRGPANCMELVIVLAMLLRLWLEWQSLDQYSVLCNIILALRPFRLVLRIPSMMSMLQVTTWFRMQVWLVSGLTWSSMQVSGRGDNC
jgi:hypothetical protein